VPQYIELADGGGRLVSGYNLPSVRRARPWQVRNCFALKPEEAKQIGHRCYICDHVADLYIEAGEAPDLGKEIVWRYTMFLCSWCVKIHDVEIQMKHEETARDSEEAPKMVPMTPFW
jgi:hypothetical protein